jgi:hypothetical protein
MAKELSEYLKNHPSQGFVSRPQYFAEGDFVSYFLVDERCYAMRVDSLLTLYHSMTSQELIGCKIKGVRRLLEKLGKFGVLIEDGEGTQLGLLFLAAASLSDEPSRRAEYEKLGQRLGQAKIETGELVSV